MPLEFHSPSRPRSPFGLPQYAEGQAALPGIYVKPATEPSQVMLEVFLVTAANEARAFRKSVPMAELEYIFSAYSAAPEALLLDLFGYTPPVKGAAKPTGAAVSLSDLGL